MKGEFITIETAQIMADIEKENKELQQRIDKARKYLSTLKTYPFMEKFYIKDVENILRGDDNE